MGGERERGRNSKEKELRGNSEGDTGADLSADVTQFKR